MTAETRHIAVSAIEAHFESEHDGAVMLEYVVVVFGRTLNGNGKYLMLAGPNLVEHHAKGLLNRAVEHLPEMLVDPVD